MKWYRDPIFWILMIRGVVVIGGLLLLIWAITTFGQ